MKLFVSSVKEFKTRRQGRVETVSFQQSPGKKKQDEWKKNSGGKEKFKKCKGTRHRKHDFGCLCVCVGGHIQVS